MSNPDNPTAQNLNLAQHLIEVAAVRGRPELVEQIRRKAARAEMHTHRVVLCGGFKAGKSSLMNALLEARVSPSHPIEATAVPLTAIHGDIATGAYVATGDEPRFQPIPQERLHDAVLGRPFLRDTEILSVVARVPAPVLQGGVVLVDTPPIAGGIASSAATAVLTELQRAAAFIFVADASQELTAPDLEFIAAARTLCPTVLCCLTKKDLYGHWTRIMEIDEGRLRDIGIDTPVLPASPALYHAGMARSDADLVRTSGIPLLTAFIATQVVARARHENAVALAEILVEGAEELAADLRTEAMVLREPNELAELHERAVTAKQRADAFVHRDRDWRRVLQRELRRIAEESRHHLQARLGDLEDWARERIEESDPARNWLDFEGRLQRETNQAIVDQIAFVHRSGETAVERTAASMAQDAESIGISLDDIRMPAGIADLDLDDEIFGGRIQGAQSGVVAARMGGATGITLFGALVNPIGAPIAAAIGLGAALTAASIWVLGGRTSRVEQRRNKALIEVNRYMKDARIVCDKVSTDAVGRVQDQIADAFESLGRRLAEDAEQNLRTYAEAKARSEQQVPARLGELETLARQVETVRQLAEHVLTGAPS